MMKISFKKKLYFVLCACFYIGFSIVYFTYFNNIDETLFYNYFNTHDHYVYKKCIDAYLHNDYSCLGLNNNFGIAYLYYLIYKIILFFDDDFADLAIVAFVVNSVVLAFLFVYIYKILNYFKLLKYRIIIIILLNLSLIYFLQFINKDLLTLLVIAMVIYLLLTSQVKLLLFLLPVFFMIRIQLVMYVLSIIFLVSVKQRKTAVFLLYLITSILSGIVASNANLIGDGLAPGVSNFVYEINQKYYLGSVVFNPLRVLVFLLSPFNVLRTELLKSDHINMFLLLNIPIIILYFLLGWRACIPLFRKRRLRREGWILTASIISFVLVWLMNPTINVRYVLLIVPNVILLAIYNKNYRGVI